jgi:hypothetical protein
MTMVRRLVEGDRKDNSREFCVDSTNELPAGRWYQVHGLNVCAVTLVNREYTVLAHL